MPERPSHRPTARRTLTVALTAAALGAGPLVSTAGADPEVARRLPGGAQQQYPALPGSDRPVDIAVRPPADRVVTAAASPPRIVYSVARTASGSSRSAVVRLDPLSGRARTLIAGNGPVLLADAWSASLFRVFYTRAAGNRVSVASLPQAGGRSRVELANGEAVDVSRSGRRIVFSRPEGETENVFVADVGGRNLRRLTGKGGFAPRFSADGRRVVFSRSFRVPGGEQADLFTVRVDGRGLRRVTGRTDTDDVLGSFSPDGRRLLFTRGAVDGNDLYTVGLDGRGLRLVRRNAVAGDWAVNGWLTYIAYRSRADAVSGTGQVAVRAPGRAGRERVLTRETSFLTSLRFAR